MNPLTLLAWAPLLGPTDLPEAAARPLIARRAADGTWVRGRSYKAHGGEGRFVFIPFLGSAAPRNAPVAFGLETVTVGGRPVPLDEAALDLGTTDRVTLRRGPAAEHYDLHLDFVEQSFTFDAALTRGQETVLRIGVQTELEGRPTAEGGFLFEGPLGGVSYGRAIAFDEGGLRADVPARLDEGGISLTVPAGFTARATGTITVDPIIATFSPGGVGSAPQVHCDVAFDATTGTYTYAYDERFSGADFDVFWSTRTPDGTVVASGAMDLSQGNFVEPKIAGTNWADAMAIVAGERTLTDTTIRLMRLSVPTNTAGPLLDIATVADPLFPSYDIGGEAGDFPAARFRVVWVDNDAAFGSRIGQRVLGSVGFISSQRFFDTVAGETKSHVCVSKSLGMDLPFGDLRSNIAYVAESPGGTETQVRIIRLNANGAVTEGPAAILTVSGPSDFAHLDVSDPIAVPGAAPAYFVAHQQASTTGDTLTGTLCRGDAALIRPLITLQEHASRLTPRQFPRLATTPTHILLSYLESDGFELDAYLTTLSPTGSNTLAVAERRILLGRAGPDTTLQGGPALVTEASGGAFGSQGASVAWSDTSTDGTNGRIRAITYELDPARAIAQQYCESSVNSSGQRGFLTLLGDGGPAGTKRAVARGLPPFQFGYLNSGTFFDILPGAGGSAGTLCLGGTIGRYVNQVLPSDGNGTLESVVDPQAIPSGGALVSAVAGQAWFFQVWHRDVVGGAQTSNFTNGVIWFVE